MSEQNSDLTQERKQQILAAAGGVFARRGYHQARMDDIVEAAGLSKGAVYWYFDSKEQIFLSLLDQIFGQEFKAYSHLLHAPLGVRQRLHGMLEMVLAQLSDTEELMPIIYEFYAAAARESNVREAVQRYLREYRGLILQIVEDGMQRGELMAVDSAQTANVLSGYLEGMLLMWVMGILELSPRSVHEQVAFGLNLIMDSLELPSEKDG